MPDVYHNFGSDLQVSSTGDLQTVDGTELGQQRVLRRLLTNPGDYIWRLSYGAGLPGFVGQPANAVRLAAIARTQMYRESRVARTPPPKINVIDSYNGTITMNILYVDAPTQRTVPLTFSITG